MLVMDGLLVRLCDADYTVECFADTLVITVRGKHE